MNVTIHERPGVYSSYDALSVVRGGKVGKTVGVAAIATAGTPNEAVLLSSFREGLEAFRADGETAGMEAVLRALYENGATAVQAVRVDTTGESADYASAFAALGELDGVDVIVCDSTDLAVQQMLKESVERAGALQRERIAVVGASGARASELIEHAAQLNSERVVLSATNVPDEDGRGAILAAAAVAAAVAANDDPSVPINGTALQGLSGLTGRFTDTEIDLLVRGGVTPVEAVGGTVSPVRAVTTRTTTGGESDSTWRELTTILVVDDVIPTIRSALRTRFARSKNTAQSRGAIRSQVILELEDKLANERIDSYGEVKVSAVESDPTVCLVEFSFAVAHGLTRIYLTAHITV
ncbi:MAG: phage tail sheath subtilisin-like domain-containing protein [Oscillospiraceae bacterium]|nr:phage tail sheath subtilisin-like domain-containing protein [Oscillospiraceae bacterium]